MSLFIGLKVEDQDRIRTPDTQHSRHMRARSLN